MRVYIETTIPSYVVARPAADLQRRLRQETTKAWWETERAKHELFISEVVLKEISKGEAEMAQRRAALLQDFKSLALTDGVRELARTILSGGLLPASAAADATHIALASIHSMDILLSWNFRHIANAAIQPRLRRLVASCNSTLPVICTPHQLFS
jgi:hypothetical protein